MAETARERLINFVSVMDTTVLDPALIHRLIDAVVREAVEAERARCLDHVKEHSGVCSRSAGLERKIRGEK